MQVTWQVQQITTHHSQCRSLDRCSNLSALQQWVSDNVSASFCFCTLHTQLWSSVSCNLWLLSPAISVFSLLQPLSSVSCSLSSVSATSVFSLLQPLSSVFSLLQPLSSAFSNLCLQSSVSCNLCLQSSVNQQILTNSCMSSMKLRMSTSSRYFMIASRSRSSG